MRNLFIPVILLALGVVGLGMIGRGRTPRMDAAADKATALKEIVRRAKQRIAALRKERREIVERHHAEIDRIKREKLSRDIQSL